MTNEQGLVAKLLSRCERQGQCLVWTGGKTGAGYGEFWYRGKRYRTHRLAFLTFKGEIPSGYMVCHTCDNRPCIEPSHLFTGTNKDNLGDMARKGRAAKGDKNGARLYPERLARGGKNGTRLHPERLPRGEKHGMAKLTDEQVGNIRREHEDGISMYRLAKNYGVTAKWIKMIVQHRSRKLTTEGESWTRATK